MLKFLALFLVGTSFVWADVSPIQGEEVKSLLKQELQNRVSLSGDFDLSLTNGKLRIVRGRETDHLVLIDMTVSPDQRSFEAKLSLEGDGGKGSPQIVKGKIEALSEIPVLTRAITPGELIGESDISWQKIPSTRLSQSMVIQKDDLVGKTASSRVLQPAQPLNRSDVKSPILVKRGDTVTVSYRSDAMFLTTAAVADQEGARGDFIRLKALASKRVIQARVMGPNQAEITPVGFAQ